MQSMMDIIQAKSTELSTQPESTTPVLDEKPPVLERLEYVFSFMLKDVLESPRTSKRAKFMMRKIVEEAMLELQEAPPEMIEENFARSTALMHWVSTGEVIQNIPVPDGFWEYVGAEKTAELSSLPQFELEAGVNIE